MKAGKIIQYNCTYRYRAFLSCHSIPALKAEAASRGWKLKQQGSAWKFQNETNSFESKPTLSQHLKPLTFL